MLSIPHLVQLQSRLSLCSQTTRCQAAVYATSSMSQELKPLFFVGSSRDDVRAFPEDVKDVVGFALHLAQTGQKHPHARPLQGFGGAGVLEIVETHDGNAYRAVYTVRFAHAIYVLHAFQKKSRRGIATPRQELDLIRHRLHQAEEHHTKQFSRETTTDE
jgi:phage-related protein